MCAAMLALQAVVLFLTTPVMISLGGIDVAPALGVGGGLAVLCLVTAGLLRKDWAYYLGWSIQVASIAMGALVTPMYVLGVIFAALWTTAFVMGGRIDTAQQQAETDG
jgi:hypothetical protein